MATQQQMFLIHEAGRRGLLNNDQVQAAFELQRRGKLEGDNLIKVKSFMAQNIERKKQSKAISDDLGVAGRAVVGLGRGFKDVGEGLAQTALEIGEAAKNIPQPVRGAISGMGPAGAAINLLSAAPEGSAENFTQMADKERQIFDQNLGDSGAASFGRFTGNVLPTLLVPGGVAGNALTRAGTAGLAGLGTGAVSYVPEGGSRAQQAALGGLFGAGTSGVMSGLGAGMKALKTSGNPLSEIETLAQKFDVPVTAGEVNSSPSLQALETQLERVPGVGIRGFREKQSEALKAAATKLKDQYNGGDDVGTALQGSLTRTFQAAKKKASRLYDQVGKASQYAKTKVTPAGTRQLAKEIIKNEKAIPALRDAGLIEDLRAFSNLKDMSFDQARKVRSRLLATVRQAEKKAVQGGISDEQVRALSRLSQAFDNDISQYAAREGGSIASSYNKANKFYRENVVPFKDKQFRRVLSDDFDTDNILATFVKRDSVLRGRGKQAEKLVSKLDLEGKKAVKHAVLAEAFEKAANTADNVPFSPAKFAQEIKKLSDANKVIFDASEKAQLDGFVKLAEATKRAGQYAENPPTGLRAADLGLGIATGAAAVANLPAAAAGLGATKSLSLLLTTKTGRKILERAKNVTVGSRSWAVVTDQANSEIARILASRSASNQGIEAAKE